ncbi:MAG: hypothetical protein V1676_01345 [Candidatus Diapherotrites archaeon]
MPNAAGTGASLKKIRLKHMYFTPQEAALATGFKGTSSIINRAKRANAVPKDVIFKEFGPSGRLLKNRQVLISPEFVTRLLKERKVPFIDRKAEVTKTDFINELGIRLGKYATGFKAWRIGKIKWEKRVNEQGMVINALPRGGKEIKNAVRDMGDPEKEKEYQEMMKREKEKKLSKMGKTPKIKDMLINHPRLGKIITIPRLLECHGINPSFGYVVVYSKEIAEGWPTFKSRGRETHYLKQGDPRINSAVEKLREFIEKSKGKVTLRDACPILNTSFGSVDLLVRLGKIPEDKVLKGRGFTLVDREYIKANREYLRKEGMKARTDANWENEMAEKGAGLDTAKSIIKLLRKRQEKLGEETLSTLKISKFIKSIQNNEAALKELHYLKTGKGQRQKWEREADMEISETLKKSPDSFRFIEAAFSEKLDGGVIDGMLRHFDTLRNMNGKEYLEKYSLPKIKYFMLALSQEKNPNKIYKYIDYVLSDAKREAEFYGTFDSTVRKMQRIEMEQKQKSKPIYSALR